MINGAVSIQPRFILFKRRPADKLTALLLKKLGSLPTLPELEDTETLKNSSQIKGILLRYCQATQPNYWLAPAMAGSSHTVRVNQGARAD